MSLCSFGKSKNARYLLESMECLFYLRSSVGRLQAFLKFISHDFDGYTDDINRELDNIEVMLKKITKLWTAIPDYLADILSKGNKLKDEWKSFMIMDVVDDDIIQKLMFNTIDYYEESLCNTYKSFKDNIKQKV